MSDTPYLTEKKADAEAVIAQGVDGERTRGVRA